jgi:hypothetical protein
MILVGAISQHTLDRFRKALERFYRGDTSIEARDSLYTARMAVKADESISDVQYYETVLRAAEAIKPKTKSDDSLPQTAPHAPPLPRPRVTPRKPAYDH